MIQRPSTPSTRNKRRVTLNDVDRAAGIIAGKIDGMAVRIPTINVSLVDLSFVASRETNVNEVNQLMAAAEQSSVLGYNDAPLVSVDFNHNPLSSIFDSSQTKVSGRLVKVMAWYDKEWGFPNRMSDNTLALFNA